MSSSSGDSLKIQQENDPEKKCSNYKGIRRRKWGKWVSEIRIPGKKERLWLGSYSTPEAAAVAHDVASYCLRGPSSTRTFNFPTLCLPSSVRDDMSPKSIQKAASDAGMAVDAHSVLSRLPDNLAAANLGGSTGVIYCAPTAAEVREEGGGGGGHHGSLEGEGDGYELNISVEDYL